LIDLAAKLAVAKNESNNEFEDWRKILEQSCREQREEILATFPWVQFHDLSKIHLNHESAKELKQLWEQINAPVSQRRLADETKSQLAILDKLLTAEPSSALNPELAKLLPDLRSWLDAAGQKASASLKELENLAQRCDELARMDFTILY